MLQYAEPAFDVLHILAQAINRTADVPKMLEDQVLDFSHIEP